MVIYFIPMEYTGFFCRFFKLGRMLTFRFVFRVVFFICRFAPLGTGMLQWAWENCSRSWRFATYVFVSLCNAACLCCFDVLWFCRFDILALPMFARGSYDSNGPKKYDIDAIRRHPTGEDV